ncbi:YciI family protein [Brevibacillus ginsengisoli]|uniref:YciI family protein n=1 Tax=Brevibacillus ginsengisoli TaxID=363854 RepID=UPI003CED68CD
MFIVLPKYVKGLEEVDQHMEAHKEFLDKYYQLSKFIVSGRRNPRVGGVILVKAESEVEVLEIIKEDPFYQNQVAEYEIIEFQPTKWDTRFEAFLS